MPPLFEAVSAIEAGFFGGAGFYLRVSVLCGIALVLFGVLGIRVWSLQVIQHERYTRVAQTQTFRFVDLPAPRGSIVDARGRLLVGADARLAVVADAGTPAVALRRLARVARVPLAQIRASMRASLVRSPFTPAVALPRIGQTLALYLDERAPRFPGLHVASLPSRAYPQGALGSEFLGLLGEVSRAQLGAHAFPGARPGEIVGQSGVERTYDRLLTGGWQRARARVDALGRTVGRLQPLPSRERLHGLRLTIDAQLQRTARRAIRDGIRLAHEHGHMDARAGAAVVLDPRTGAVKALASYPDFNETAAANDPRYLGRLLASGGSLVDRAAAGIYPAGSTFKPIVAEAALATGILTPSSILQCTGSLRVGNIVFHNVEAGIDAPLDLEQALAISCDTWFYRLGQQFYARQAATGRTELQNWARFLGFGHPTGFDVPGEAAGVVPTPAWLRRTFEEPWEHIWYEGTSVNLSIGQGYLAVTPLQLAVAYSALANGGKVVRPHVADAVLDGDGRVLRRLAFPPRRRLRLVGLQAIRDGLYQAAHAPGGTSSSVFGDFPVPVAGKTGTAEAPGGSDHSWYASWAPAGKPRVVVVVLIEHGGFGAEAAAPAAREIYAKYFGVKAPR